MMLLLLKWYSVLPSWNAVKPLWEVLILGISSEREGFLIITTLDFFAPLLQSPR